MSAKPETACCPKDSVQAGTPGDQEAGKVIKLKPDLEAYVTGSPDAGAALLVAYDIFGFQGQSRIRQVCDQLAAAGFYVVLPDYFRGDQWTMARFAAEEPLEPFLKQFPWDGKAETDFAAAVAHAKAQPGVKQLGAVGFCWGAWIVAHAAKTGTVSAGYSAHPSVRVENMFGGSDVALVGAGKCPTLFDTAGSDNANLKAGGEAFEALRATPEGADSATRDFPDMKHGWVTRGDLADAAVAAGAQKALSGGIEFLQKHMLGGSAASSAAPSDEVITLGASKVSFTHVAREWRSKYTRDGNDGPHDSASLAAAEALLQEYLPTLKALPNAEVTRIVCGGCGDFKVIVNQPAADHGAWAKNGFAPEQEFLAKLEAIEGTSAVEEQEFTMASL